MPIIKSFKKSVKTSEKSRLRNISIRSKIKKSIKNFELILTEKKGEEVGKLFVDTISILDKAASKGVISKNNVARNKARLAKKLNALGIAVPKKQKVEKEVVKKVKKVKALKEKAKPKTAEVKPVEKVAAKKVEANIEAKKEVKTVEKKVSKTTEVKPVEKVAAKKVEAKKVEKKKAAKPAKEEEVKKAV